MVLKTLAGLGPLHGYGIARRIEQVTDGGLALNQGTIYPALLRLEQKGWIKSAWGTSDNNRRARFYSHHRRGTAAAHRGSRPVVADRGDDVAPAGAGLMASPRVLWSRLRGTLLASRQDRELGDGDRAPPRVCWPATSRPGASRRRRPGRRRDAPSAASTAPPRPTATSGGSAPSTRWRRTFGTACARSATRRGSAPPSWRRTRQASASPSWCSRSSTPWCCALRHSHGRASCTCWRRATPGDATVASPTPTTSTGAGDSRRSARLRALPTRR